MHELLTLDALVALLTLSSLEIVLGIDNIVLVVVVTSRLPEQYRDVTRRVGIALAMITRIALLLSISWVMGLTKPLLTITALDHAVSGKDLVLFFGGMFLLAKATLEIHDKTLPEKEKEDGSTLASASASVLGAAVQIAILDIVFSLDSVITAVGMARQVEIMIAAIVIAVAVMLFFSKIVSDFVHKYPTIQMLAFSFLLLIGVFLVAEGLHKHIERGYIYFAMAFSLFVETLNIRMRKAGKA